MIYVQLSQAIMLHSKCVATAVSSDDTMSLHTFQIVLEVVCCPMKLLAPWILDRGAAFFIMYLRPVQGFTGYAFSANMAGNQTLASGSRGTTCLASMLFKASSLQSQLAAFALQSLWPSGQPIALKYWCYSMYFFSKCLRSGLLWKVCAAGQVSSSFTSENVAACI